VPAASVGALAAAAFFGGFLGIGTFYRGLKYIGFAVGSALRSAQIIFVAILSWFTLRMQPDLKDWAGGLIIIAGVTLLTLSSARSRPPALTPEAPDD
jgi:drug/metabolite transporter (DMT)-like permease